jgi:hypothetical protein
VPSNASAGTYIVTIDFDSGPLAGVIATRSEVPIKPQPALSR